MPAMHKDAALDVAFWLGPFPGQPDPSRQPNPPVQPPAPVQDPVDIPTPGPDLPPLPEGDPSREPRREPYPEPAPLDDPDGPQDVRLNGGALRTGRREDPWGQGVLFADPALAYGRIRGSLHATFLDDHASP